MYKHECECGTCVLFYRYTIRLEGSLTFRNYVGECNKCLKKIDITDIHEDDLIEQEYLC